MDLSSRTVLITGGGSGLGRVLAADFADAGATVHVCGRRRGPLDETAATSDNIHAHTLDVTSESDTAALFAKIGVCDIVIANAGIAEGAPLHGTPAQMWERVISINLTGCFLTMRGGLKTLREARAGWGRLIVISSIAGLSGLRNAGAYTASKHGVNGLVRATALEIAGSGVTANALCPGYLDTEMTDRTVDGIMKRTGRSEKEARAVLGDMSPLGRLIAPQEVSALALWLCGPNSEAVNGQTIAINGGAH